MNLPALNTIIRYATQHIEARTPVEQAEIYDALSQLLPQVADRLAAGRVAFAIRETTKLQLDFNRLLNPQAEPTTTHEKDRE